MKKITNKSNNISQVAKYIAAWDSFILIGHEDPDGDCLGSVFSLGLLLKNLDKKVKVGLYKPLNNKYSFIKNNLELDYFIVEETTEIKEDTAIIALDSSDSERLGPAKNLLQNHKILNIDHHIDNKHFGDINYVSPDSAATGQIIYDIAYYMSWHINKTIAYYLAVAVLADTGFLRYSNTDRSVIQMIDQLMAKGVNIYEINRDLYGKEKPKNLKLIGRALNNLTILEDEKIAYLYLEKKDYEELDANFEDKEGIVNYARDIDNIEVGILFNEEDDRVKVSLRSNDYYPVNKLAAEFGGGGHPKAAGCGINLDLKTAIEQVISKAIELNKEYRRWFEISEYSGILNLLKPPGISSFGMVGWLRRVLDMRKIGHTGTLDPLAAGVLPLCVGKATRIIQFLPEGKKTYICELKFGVSTNTLDLEGKVTARDNSWEKLKTESIIEVFKSFHGKVEQIPPMFSAINYNGKRLYQLAREGKEIERESRDIEIFDLEILEINLPVIRFKVTCSKGTYIRSLVRDIGRKLNTEAVMTFLLRTESGPFKIDNSLYPEDLELNLSDKNKKDEIFIPLTRYLDFPKLKIKPDAFIRATNGAYLYKEDLLELNGYEFNKKDDIILYDNDLFISICQVDFEDDRYVLKPDKVFNIEEDVWFRSGGQVRNESYL